MPLNTIMPRTAQKIAEILRRDVPRPTELPRQLGGAGGTCLRWDNGCCPMGLHPDSNSKTPGYVGDIPGSWGVPPSGFAFWWDDQTDEQAAVDAVWGEA